MQDIIYFDPLDSFCRTCKGAIPQSSKIIFRIKLLRTQLISAKLVLIYDKTDTRYDIPMSWIALDNGYDIYSASIDTLEYKGLIWYWFELYDSCGKVFFFGEGSSGSDPSDAPVPAFQITVYNKAVTTPEWYSKGVTYHIFVDRFFRSEVSDKLCDDTDFTVHTDMSDTPEYLPNEHGEILNCDIYGGNLKGIEEKLSYLDSLGVGTLYLSPIFEAWSNHKYNTADYMRIDPHFGNEDDLRSLCEAAGKLGMHIILDGVFNHTGSDSRYFNKNNRYDTIGAYQSEKSRYRSWYSFDGSNIGYSSWWGINTLPAVNEDAPTYRDFIMGDGGVAEHWMNTGISGWRIDVADELPDEFLIDFRKKVRSCNPSAVVIGEVWEDASNKIAYGVRRKYFTDEGLDGVMNYPLKEWILGFLNGDISAETFAQNMIKLLDRYPPPVHRCLMNIIGTHDTVRAVNALACRELAWESREFKANHRMDRDQRQSGKKRLKMASCLQYMFPGSPSLYYGDETAMEGFEDPFNRRFYPWNEQDTEMISHYQKLGKIKRCSVAMHDGTFSVPFAFGDCIGLMREKMKNCVLCIVNRGGSTAVIDMPRIGVWRELFSGYKYTCRKNKSAIEVPPECFYLFELKKQTLPKHKNSI